MNRTSVRDSIKWMFSKRDPRFTPDPLVLDSWTDDLMAIPGMTDQEVFDGCNEFSRSTQRMDYAVFLNTIRTVARRKAEDMKAVEQKQDWGKLKDLEHKAPAAVVLAFEQMSDGPHETVEQIKERRTKLLDAIREEAKKHPEGSEMRAAWVKAGLEHKRWCEDRPAEQVAGR